MNRWNEMLAKKWKEVGEEPSDGHFERFREKLEARKKKERFDFLLLKTAAVVLLIIVAAGIYTWRPTVSEIQRTVSVDNEIDEASYYYTTRINNGLEEIERLVKEGTGSEKEILEIKKEFSGMDHQFVSLNIDFQNNPRDERVRKAVIEYYQAKLEIVSIIKREMENVKQQKK